MLIVDVRNSWFIQVEPMYVAPQPGKDRTLYLSINGYSVKSSMKINVKEILGKCLCNKLSEFLIC